jgi:hypothetical protein
MPPQVPFSALVPSNGSFDSVLPGWGTGELVAVVSALVLMETNHSLAGNKPPVPTTASYSTLTVQENTMTDITKHVLLPTGHLQLEFPASEKATTYWIFAFYQLLSHHKNLNFQSNSTSTIFNNGSYTVDHFSARGAQTVTDFWDRYILTNGTKELLQEVGNCGMLYNFPLSLSSRVDCQC